MEHVQRAEKNKYSIITGGARALQQPPTDKSYLRFQVVPQSVTIGAELRGVDLSQPIDDELAEELRRALREWKVIFFRDSPITVERHLELARVWGEPEENPFFPKGDHAQISRLEKDAQMVGSENIWHSDHSFMANPARAAVLRAVEVPDGAGDTMWADMAAAYDNLPDHIKETIDVLDAEHDWITTWGRHMTEEQIAAIRPRIPTAVHPVVKTHPETGRRLLYVNEPFTQRILGVPEDESEDLLAYLRAQARTPEYQVRFRWAPGSIAIWDNWAVQHYAVNDYAPRRRVMERVAIAGDGWVLEAN